MTELIAVVSNNGNEKVRVTRVRDQTDGVLEMRTEVE
jgi:hypothetical protein